MGVVRIVCPHCQGQYPSVASGLGLKKMRCDACKGEFETLLAEVRAKRSRGSTRANTRTFDVRVDTGKRERMLRFVAPGTADLELRSGDAAAFSFIGGKLHIAQNLAVGEYLEVRPPPLPLAAKVIIGVVVAAMLGGLILLVRSA